RVTCTASRVGEPPTIRIPVEFASWTRTLRNSAPEFERLTDGVKPKGLLGLDVLPANRISTFCRIDASDVASRSIDSQAPRAGSDALPSPFESPAAVSS